MQELAVAQVAVNHPTPCRIHLAELASGLRWLGRKGHNGQMPLAPRSAGMISVFITRSRCPHELPLSSDWLQDGVTCSQDT